MKRMVRVLSAAVVLWAGLATAPLAYCDPGSNDADPIRIHAEGPTTNVAWDSGIYMTMGSTVVGAPVSVPGDRAQRTIDVTNDGQTGAMVTVEIYDVITTYASENPNPELEDIIHLFWDVNGHSGDEVWRDAIMSKRADGVSWSVSFRVAQAQTFSMTAGFYFPIDATGGRNLGQSSSVLSFKIRILMQGDADMVVKTGGGSVDGVAVGAVGVVAVGMTCLFAGILYRRYASVAQR